jgi:hypothetical protein
MFPGRVCWTPKFCRRVAKDDRTVSLSICLALDPRTDRAVRALWQRLEGAGVRTLSSHTHGRHAPHLTLASLRSWDLEAVRGGLTPAQGPCWSGGSDPAHPSGTAPLRFRVVTRVLLALCTLSWWVLPGMGAIDLTVTWDPDWPVMLEAGWGLLFTVGLGLPFLVSALRPRLARVALVQVYAVAAALLVGVFVGREPQAWWIFVMLAVELPLLHLVARRSTLGERALSPALLALAVVALVPALTYAWDMAADNRQGFLTSDITNDTDHYAVQAAVALALVALPVLAGWWQDTRRLLGTSTALIAAYLGLVSVGWPDADAGFSGPLSVVVMVWAVGVGVAFWWPAARTSVAAPSRISVAS